MEELEKIIISMGFILHIHCGYLKKYKLILNGDFYTIELFGSYGTGNLNSVLKIEYDSVQTGTTKIIYENYVTEFYRFIKEYEPYKIFVRKFKIALLNG